MRFSALQHISAFVAASVAIGAAEDGPTDPNLAIRFSDRGIVFSGQVDSEETGQSIAAAARSVRPDLPVVNRGLEVVESARVPPLGDLRSLLSELGLSTHEGGVAFHDDRVVLTGMTDSVVTVTAVRIRLEPLLEGRDLVNRICIVSPADMPDLTVRLSSGETVDSVLDFDAYPTATEAFTLPGLSADRVYPTLVLLGDFERFLDPDRKRSPQPLRAMPMNLSATESTADAAGGPQLRAVPAEEGPTRVPLEPIRFSRNSFLLQAGSAAVLARIVEQAQQEPLAGRRIILESLTWDGASPAYVEYLADRRADEAKKHLGNAGVAADRIRTTIGTTSAAADPGEVRVFVEMPPPAPKEEEGESTATASEAGVEAPDANGSTRAEPGVPSTGNPKPPE